LKVKYRESFLKDLHKIKSKEMLARIEASILQIEATSSIEELHNLKKLRGGSSYYRARIGDYRVGIVMEGGSATLVRVLHRKDIYRYFPRP
jgi:mRNA interferase RelE/StbE